MSKMCIRDRAKGEHRLELHGRDRAGVLLDCSAPVLARRELTLALFSNTSFLQHYDVICILDRLQAMGNHEMCIRDRYLTFPWDKGFTVEDMEAYYDNEGFYDYIHKLSRAPILKAQHPDYEICLMGIHGQRGASCAECHMPYKSEGGVKFSDHHIQSPLAMIDRTC